MLFGAVITSYHRRVLDHMRHIERVWGQRVGFNLASFQYQDLIAWGEKVGLFVIPAPQVTYTTIRNCNGAKHVYLNPYLPEGEKRYAVAHELKHLISKDYQDEWSPKIFAHLCCIPQPALYRLERQHGRLTPEQLFINYAPWEMVSEKRAAQVCYERMELFDVMYDR